MNSVCFPGPEKGLVVRSLEEKLANLFFGADTVWEGLPQISELIVPAIILSISSMGHGTISNRGWAPDVRILYQHRNGLLDEYDGAC